MFIKLFKLVISVFWLAELANLFQLFEEPVSQTLHIASVIVLLTHGVQVLMFNKLLESRSVSGKYNKVQVILFGFVHIRELLTQNQPSD